jgi:hypothetical protein
MLLVALLPLLALPGALAGPFRQSPVKRETPIIDGINPLRFVDTVPKDGVNRYEERLSLAYPSKFHAAPSTESDSTDESCEGGTAINGEGNDMEDRSCIRNPSIKSFWPGELYTRSGTFCLLKYKDDDCHCIESSQLFKIAYGEPQNCISVDGEYGSYSWERTYDFMVSLSGYASKSRLMEIAQVSYWLL